jgi:hypothetical protein
MITRIEASPAQYAAARKSDEVIDAAS